MPVVMFWSSLFQVFHPATVFQFGYKSRKNELGEWLVIRVMGALNRYSHAIPHLRDNHLHLKSSGKKEENCTWLPCGNLAWKSVSLCETKVMSATNVEQLQVTVGFTQIKSILLQPLKILHLPIQTGVWRTHQRKIPLVRPLEKAMLSFV